MTIHEQATQVLEGWRWQPLPFFQTLADGTFQKDDFLETQVQFLWAVTFFSRPMSMLSARIPGTRQRIQIVRNIWEEHGEGDPRLAHAHTFRELLRRLGGLDEDQIQRHTLWPEIRAFNTALTGACLMEEPKVAAATMGMIEYMFSGISGDIGRGIVRCGFLKEEELIHYSLHERLDVRHAADFFGVVGEADYYSAQGLQQGACLFHGLYRGMWEARGRRWRRGEQGAHSRV